MSQTTDPTRSCTRETPPGASAGKFGSDTMADTLRALDLNYVALNPGASYRGLHDSLVNHLGDENPKMLVCLHEEAAIAIAHGYAKVTERPMGAIVHSNVGLMHGSMAIFDAWCDRAPVVVLGATGPVDAAQRRPWIDWIHTTTDQAALVRNFTKWDNQPGSVTACVDAVLRAGMIARTAPCGPVYVVFDAALQEQKFDAIEIPDPSRFAPPVYGPNPVEIDRLAKLLADARSPVILAGRVSRNEDDWKRRIALAERLGARVLTDGKVAAAFPSHHPLHPFPAALFLSDDMRKVVAEAGRDPLARLDRPRRNAASGVRRERDGDGRECKLGLRAAPRFQHGVSNASRSSTSRSRATPIRSTEALLDALGPAHGAARSRRRAQRRRRPPQAAPFGIRDVAASSVFAAIGKRPTSFLKLPIGWSWEDTRIDGPLDYLGSDGGGGVGSGRRESRSVRHSRCATRRTGCRSRCIGDGDFLMGGTALWTAVHGKIPLLMVVANNRSYFNDELHQQRVAEDARTPGRTALDRSAHRAGGRHRDLRALARCDRLRPGRLSAQRSTPRCAMPSRSSTAAGSRSSMRSLCPRLTTPKTAAAMVRYIVQPRRRSSKGQRLRAWL